MARTSEARKVFNIADFRDKKEVTQPVINKNKQPATVVHISAEKSHNNQFVFDFNYSTKNSSNSYSSEKQTVKEEFKQAADYSPKIQQFLKVSAKYEFFCSHETTCSIRKDFDENSFAAHNSETYVIEFERPLGANTAKNRSFYKYLSSVFGQNAVSFEQSRTSRYSEKAVFSITGDDLTLMRKIKGYAAKIAQ